MQAEVYEAPEVRDELVDRITKILDCQNTGDLDIDKAMLENLPMNLNQPMFIAAECFKETLIEVGINEDSAETARRAFLTLRRNSELIDCADAPYNIFK